MTYYLSLQKEMEELTFSERESLKALLVSPPGLSTKQIKEKTGLSRAWVYIIRKKLGEKKYVTTNFEKHHTQKGQRLVAISKLTDKGKEIASYLRKPSAELGYTVDLGSEAGEISVSFDAHSPEDKHRYEAYWLTDPPLITPFLRAVDFEKPTEVNISLRIKIPSVSKDILDAVRYFAFLSEKVWGDQYRLWQENINWLQRSVAKGQGVWNTPYSQVGEVCDLLMKSPYSIFLGMMLGLTGARKYDELYHQVILVSRKESGIYNLKFAPVNIFEFLLTIVPCIKKGKRLEWSDNHLGMTIFSELLRSPDVKKWIKRCLKRDGRNWLSRIPFKNLGFHRNKEHVSDSWIFDTNFPESLGVFFSMEKEKWRHIGAVMNILLDTIMLNVLPSRLGDRLDQLRYTDDVILEAWERVKGFWEEAKNNRNLKTSISRLHKKEMGQFYKSQRKLRDACCEFLEAVSQTWKGKGTRRLFLYLPGKISSSRPLELNPLYPYFGTVEALRRILLNRLRLLKNLYGDYYRHKDGVLDLEEAIEVVASPRTDVSALEELQSIVESWAISSGKIDRYLEHFQICLTRIIKTVKDNAQTISSGKEILGSRRKRQHTIATEEHDSDRELEDYLEKLDYDDLIDKLAELSKSCPP